MPAVMPGLAETRRALRQFAPDLLKESDREMKQVLKVIVVQARGFVPRETPMRNWDVNSSSTRSTRWTDDLAFSSSAIKRGIKSKIGRQKADRYGFSAIYRIINETPAGSVYETAGRKNPKGKRGDSNNPKAGAQFIDNIQKQADQWTPVGMPHGEHQGRLVWAAVNKNRRKVTQAIRVSVGVAEEKFHARTNSIGFVGKR